MLGYNRSLVNPGSRVDQVLDIPEEAREEARLCLVRGDVDGAEAILAEARRLLDEQEIGGTSA